MMRTTIQRGFSLVEVLLAIIILGIGIISIAALFPAGIAQQRLASDDIMGPVVANHAMSMIRSKVKQEDFGTFREFLFDDPTLFEHPPLPTLDGDWPWMRPSFLLANDASTLIDERGAIDIFSNRRVRQRVNEPGLQQIRVATEWWEGWPESYSPGDRSLFGIPFNRARHGGFIPPRMIITQEERYYPMRSTLVEGQEAARPQYVWDCMFRRYQGRVYVAIFVYRVSAAGGDRVAWRVPAHRDADGNMTTLPPMPIMLNLNNAGDWYAGGVWNVAYDNGRAAPFVPGVGNPDNYDVYDTRQSWQESRQWLLDQNNNVYRVLSRDDDADAEWRVELSRPLSPVRLPFLREFANNTLDGWPSDAPQYYLADPNAGSIHPDLPFHLLDVGVVTNIWYLPRRVLENPGAPNEVEYMLTPVFVTVKEL